MSWAPGTVPAIPNGEVLSSRDQFISIRALFSFSLLSYFPTPQPVLLGIHYQIKDFRSNLCRGSLCPGGEATILSLGRELWWGETPLFSFSPPTLICALNCVRVKVVSFAGLSGSPNGGGSSRLLQVLTRGQAAPLLKDLRIIPKNVRNFRFFT